MSEWKTVRLGDVFELQMGKTPDRKRLDYFKGSHKWISIADISKSEKYISETKESLTDDAISSSGIKIIPKDTVIMSFKLTIGKTAITSNEMYSNEAIMAFLPNKKYETDNSFLYHLFSNKNWSEGSNKAVKGITLNKASLSEMTILLPPLETQKQIAAVLDKCTSLISKYKKILEKYDTLIKSRFIEMFGDPSKNNKKWEIKKLGDIIRVLGGYAFSSKAFKESGIPVLRIGNINSGVFRPTNMVFWDDDEKIERYAIYPSDLVMSLTGTVGKDDYGNVCILGNDYPKYYLNQRNAKLEIISDLERLYLSYLLKFPEIKSRLTNISRGIRQANIANKDIENLQIPVPPLSLQNDFATFVQQIDKSKFAVQKSLEKAETLYKSLMQEYFG